MANGDDKAKPGGAAGRRKRPVKPRTIDLKATEVGEADDGPASEQAPEAEAGAPEKAEAEAAGPGATTDAAPESPQTDAEKELASSEAAGDETAPAPDEEPASGPSRRPGIMSGAVAGAAAALIVAFALMLTGLLPIVGQDAALREALTATEARIAALEEAAPAVPDAEAIETRLEALEARLEAVPTEAPDLAAIESRIAELEAAPAPEAALPDDVDDRIAALADRLDGLEDAVSDVAAGAEPDAEFTRRLARLEEAVSAERAARETLADRLDALADTLREDERADARHVARAAAGALALSGLMRATEAGRPHAAELAALQPLLADAGQVATLAAHAETGLPTRAELEQEFGRAAQAILGAPDDPDRDDGAWSQLVAGARTLVRVRPAGPVEGDSRPAIVSRIEAALAGHDLDAAHQEWQRLDTAARDASSEWAARLETRRSAEAELSAIAAETAAALGEQSGDDQ